MNLSVDALIVYTFLLITLLVGLWAGRGIKDIREYAIANKVYGTGILTITFLATYIEAWNVIGLPGDVFADGLTQLVPVVGLGVIVCLLAIARFIAPKMVAFEDCITMGDLMGKFYGTYGRIITGFLGLIYNSTAVSIQIVFLRYVCGLLGFNSDWGLVIAAFVLVIYSSIGGIKSVTVTDIVQFVVLVAGLSLLVNVIVYQVGGFKQLFALVPPEKMKLFNFSQDKMGAFGIGYYSFPILALWYLFPGFPLSFPFIQRMLMAKNKQHIANMYYISAAFLTIFFLLLGFIGLGAVVLYPQISSSEVVPYLIKKIPLGGFQGLAIAGLLAVIMSTADSFLHSAGVLLAHDVIKPIYERRSISINELNVAQYATFFVGTLAIILALTIKDIFKIAMYGMDLAALLFTIPLIAGIMGLKTHYKSFIISIICTLLAFSLCKIYLSKEWVIPCSILANAASFFGTHWIQRKSFIIVKRLNN
jgi:SSS family solute:Na+ symporter